MSTPYTYDKLDQESVTSHLFQPPVASTSKPDNCQDILIDTADGATVHLRAFGSDLKDKPVILLFHDGSEQVSDYTDIVALYIKNLGTSCLIAEYRGYGLASGTPSATTMLADSKLIFHKALEWKKANGYSGKMVCMGVGLGCTSAIEVVHNHPDQTDALMIDSGFTFTLPVLKAMGVDVAGLAIREEDCFHNLEKIREINKPLYVIHMGKDDFIPMDNPSNLVSESKGQQKEFQIVPGKADGSILDTTGNMYFEVMGRFVKNIGIVRKKKVGVR